MPFLEKNPPDVPILPGPDYRYLQATPPAGKAQFHKSHTLGFKNGLAVRSRPSSGVGTDPSLSSQLPHDRTSQLMDHHEYPDLADIAGLTRTAPPPAFVPRFCKMDKKVRRT